MTVLAGAAAYPLAAGAQPNGMPIIGFLGSPTAGSYTTLVAAFLHGLEEMGYIEGQNVAIEYRWAEGRFERPITASGRNLASFFTLSKRKGLPHLSGPKLAASVH
jgi:putative ABC transport system substrate-binding protein